MLSCVSGNHGSCGRIVDGVACLEMAEALFVNARNDSNRLAVTLDLEEQCCFGGVFLPMIKRFSASQLPSRRRPCCFIEKVSKSADGGATGATWGDEGMSDFSFNLMDQMLLCCYSNRDFRLPASMHKAQVDQGTKLDACGLPYQDA